MEWKYSGWRVWVTRKEPIVVVGEHVSVGRGQRVIALTSKSKKMKKKNESLFRERKVFLHQVFIIIHAKLKVLHHYIH